MKRIVLVALLCSFASAFAHDCQVLSNGIGDWRVLTIGGLTFAKPVSVDLAPVNAPEEAVPVTVRCQLVYKDKDIPRPETEADLEVVRQTGNMLTAWFVGFIRENYGASDYATLLEFYRTGKLAEELNASFPGVVTVRNEELAAADRLNVESVTVQVEAEGAFREALKTFVQ